MALGVFVLTAGALKLSTIKWDSPRQIAASRMAPGSSRLTGQAPVQIAAAHDRTVTAGSVMPSVQPHATPMASALPAAPAMPPPATPPKAASGPSSPSMLVFNDAGSRAPDRNVPPAATHDDASGNAEDDLALPPAAVETLIAQAPLVVPENRSRTIVLPISFGKPLAPEDDAAPVTLRWRFHGLHNRHSYFLPAPGGPSVGDALGQIGRTQNFLR